MSEWVEVLLGGTDVGFGGAGMGSAVSNTDRGVRCNAGTELMMLFCTWCCRQGVQKSLCDKGAKLQAQGLPLVEL